MAKLIGALVMAAVTLTSAAVTAAESDGGGVTQESILAQIAEIEQDPLKLQAAMRAGKERIMLCAHCHGEDGNSLRPEIPNLAGQNPPYLIEQVQKFADGRRKNFVMQTLAANFTLEDKVNLAIYFNNQTLKPVAVDPLRAKEAEHIYKSVCQFCHGDSGKGEAGYARIAGQRPQYVMTTLQRFRAAAQHKVNGADIKRSNSRMEQVSQSLTDQEIEALAHYIALLR
ncbi:MAG TPA: c-type cytochrome [Gammaproteobacteria bacterium]